MSTSAPSQLPAEYSSRTLTITPTPTPEAGPSNPDPSNGGGPPNVRVLRLRGGPNRRQKVVWSEETVDNEGMGKKRSKICCIYHRPKAYDESSSESSSDSEGGKDPEKDERRANGGMKRREKVEGGKGEVEESSDSESDGGAGKGNARPPQKPRKHRHHHHSHDCGHDKHQSSANRYDHTGMASGKGKKPA